MREMRGTGPALTAQTLLAAKRRMQRDDRSFGAKVDDLRDRVTVALQLSGLDRCPADVFFVMRAMQIRRQRHGLAADPIAVIHATFASLCPASAGR